MSWFKPQHYQPWSAKVFIFFLAIATCSFGAKRDLGQSLDQGPSDVDDIFLNPPQEKPVRQSTQIVERSFGTTTVRTCVPIRMRDGLGCGVMCFSPDYYAYHLGNPDWAASRIVSRVPNLRITTFRPLALMSLVGGGNEIRMAIDQLRTMEIRSARTLPRGVTCLRPIPSSDNI